MTGSERSGPEAASADLFRDAPFFLCPISSTPKHAVSGLTPVLEGIGAQPVVLDAEKHDRLVAQLSHLPQILSTLIADQASGDTTLAGPGWKSMTRLAGSPFHVWRDILQTSRFLPQELKSFETRLRAVVKALESGNVDELEAVFEKANRLVAGRIMNKVVENALKAIEDIQDGASIMMGGFGLCGIPENLVRALHLKGTRNLTVISNNAGVDDFGIGILLKAQQIRKMVATYVGENHTLEQLALAGKIELELNPQGTFCERIRAGGAGIPAFYTPTGFGTLIAEGKETREFDGRMYVMERAMRADFAFVKAWKGDRFGNLVYRKTARNFNPMMAMAGHVTIAEGGAPCRAGRH
jgi:3-oxoacid CoA-transferase subunit A